MALQIDRSDERSGERDLFRGHRPLSIRQQVGAFFGEHVDTRDDMARAAADTTPLVGRSLTNLWLTFTKKQV